jgi:hypothetical protein
LLCCCWFHAFRRLSFCLFAFLWYCGIAAVDLMFFVDWIFACLNTLRCWHTVIAAPLPYNSRAYDAEWNMLHV